LNGAATNAGAFSQSGQRLASQFYLASASSVDRATWHGTMYSADPLDTGNTWSFDLVIYGDASGLPGSALASYPVTASVIDTGVNIGGERVYQFDASFDAVALPAEASYWFSVVNTGTQNTFRWTRATVGLGTARSSTASWRVYSEPAHTPPNFALHAASARTPGAALEQLLGSVTGVGPGKSLAAKVVLAQTYYAVPDVQATCAVLADFADEVRAQRGKRLAAELADQLDADALEIMTAVGCN
jgi:hypothetical protein